MGTREKTFEPDAFDCLLQYRWPGNVRELENVIERALALSQDPTLTPDDLPAHITNGHAALPLRAIAEANGR